MKRTLTASIALLCSAPIASAGGLDRTGLPIGILFEDGNYAELSFAQTTPSISGRGAGIALAGLPAGTSYSGVGGDFGNLGLGVKLQLTEQLSAAVFFEQPFGSDITYNGNSATTELGGTRAIADTNMISALLRYEFDDRFSVHGGLRIARSQGEIDLRGIAYGGLNGYSVELDSDTAVGYTLGVAYEIPDIALRVALTYNSAITHKFDTSETGLAPIALTSTTEVDLPQSVALDFQTGVAPGTLVFGQIRWAEWSAFQINPENFTAIVPGGLVDLDDEITYTLGVGRQFTDAFSGSFAISYEPEDKDDLVSPLAPTNGMIAYRLGGQYTFDNGTTLSGGIRYTKFGDARPETGTPDTARAAFDDNSALTIGFKVGFTF